MTITRLAAVTPAGDGYGSLGTSAVGIKSTDTLVFVIDILSSELTN